MRKLTSAEVDELAYSDEYAEYIMEHGDRHCGNGDMLLQMMEDNYLLDAFMESIGVEEE